MSTVGKYLATRFEQIGLKHYFMVPGDYNLVLLDELLSNKNVQQIGCCNELNAAYAAEGYARVNGCGAVITTFNVGAFSALAGVAGAFAERLPVIFVSSGLNTNDPPANRLLHHTIATHDFSYQEEMFEKVTCASVRILHADNAPDMIDHAIGTALRERKPAYIEIACNLSNATCPDPGPFEPLAVYDESNSNALYEAVEHASTLLADAKKPLMLAGAELRSFGAIDAFRELAEALGCAVAVMPNAKGLFPEDHPQYIGVYWGDVSSPGCQGIVSWTDLVLTAGPVFTDYTTAGWTALPAPNRLISVAPRNVRLPEAEFTNVAMADFLPTLATKVPANSASLVEYQHVGQGGEDIASELARLEGVHGRGSISDDEFAAAKADVLGRKSKNASAAIGTPVAPATGLLTRAEMSRQIQGEIDAKTTLLVEGGDAWFNAMYMHLPDGAKFEISMQWAAIGWAVPAAFGYGMGLERDRRLISIIGDGGFQLSAQEVANMIRYGQNALIFLLNNRGYVSESEIHEGPYNYFKNWDYAGLMAAWNADDGHGLGLTATTASELSDAIKKAHAHRGGPVLIECQIEHDDCTRELLTWGANVGRANTRLA
jgi:pyruvate decarboxylase